MKIKNRVCFRAFISLFLVFALFLGGCGYTLQVSNNPLLKQGIRKIYVPPVSNSTYKPGVESTVYNNLIRTILAHKKIILVHNPQKADAVLYGSVNTAMFSSAAGTTVGGLNPQGLGGSLPTAPFVISTIYTANLACSFSLVRTKPKKGQDSTVWSATFNRSEPFPASNQLDVPGTTSALINDSEFDRALSDLSRSMMDDVHESMLAMF